MRLQTERLNELCTPEGDVLPPNTLAELRRDMARLRFIIDQINEIEAARLLRLEQAEERSLGVEVGENDTAPDLAQGPALALTLRVKTGLACSLGRAVARCSILLGQPLRT